MLRNWGAFTPPLRRRASTCASVARNSNWPSAVRKLTSGWFLISVGIANVKTRSVRIYINLDRGIVHTIHATAQMRALSRFGFLAEAAQNKIKGSCKLLIKKIHRQCKMAPNVCLNMSVLRNSERTCLRGSCRPRGTVKAHTYVLTKPWKWNPLFQKLYWKRSII